VRRQGRDHSAGSAGDFLRETVSRVRHAGRPRHLPSGRFAPNGAWLAVMAHDLAGWTARIALCEDIVTTRTLRRRLFGVPGRLIRSARIITSHLPGTLAVGAGVRQGAGRAPGHRHRGLITAIAAMDLAAACQRPDRGS
jgi:hypothetical protein